MSPEERPLFDPSCFVNSETGSFENLLEFNRQTEAAIATGNIEPVLLYLADKISSSDEPESRLHLTFLLDFMERTDNPDAVLFHARNLTELAETRDRHLEAAVTSRLASSVYLEKGRLREAADWFSRMRNNLFASFDDEKPNDMVAAAEPGIIREILEYESFYLLELAGKGRAKQVRKDIARLYENPVTPAERHHLACTLAFLESDLGNHITAMNALKRAERAAVDVGDYADASIYASLRTTQIMVVMGRIGVKNALDAAANYLEQARNSDNEPEMIAKAKEQLDKRRQIFS